MENFWQAYDEFWSVPQTRNNRDKLRVIFDRAVREAHVSKIGPDAVHAIGPAIEMAYVLEDLK